MAAHNNARLLCEMLDSYSRENGSAQDLELIHELHASCLRFQPNVQTLLSEIPRHDDRLYSQCAVLSFSFRVVIVSLSTIFAFQKLIFYLKQFIFKTNPVRFANRWATRWQINSLLIIICLAIIIDHNCWLCVCYTCVTIIKSICYYF